MTLQEYRDYKILFEKCYEADIDYDEFENETPKKEPEDEV